MKTKTRIGIPHLLSKPYPNIFISLSQEETISHTSTESARRGGNKREEKKYNVPPSLRRGKSFSRGSLQTRTGNEIILADLRSCVFVINYGLWRGIYLRECGRRWEPRKCVIITTNRQTDKQNRRTPCYVAQSDNNQLQCWKRCKHWDWHRDGIDRQRDGQTDKAKRVLLPNAKSEAHSLTTILLYVCCVNKMLLMIHKDIYRDRQTRNVLGTSVECYPKSITTVSTMEWF